MKMEKEEFSFFLFHLKYSFTKKYNKKDNEFYTIFLKTITNQKTNF